MKKIMIGAMMCATAMVTLLTSCEDTLETKNFTDMSPRLRCSCNRTLPAIDNQLGI